VLGILGALGAVELRPQLSVSPQEAIEKSQPFSVPFRIQNSGYLSFHVDQVVFYAAEITTRSLSIHDSGFASADWRDFDLDRGEQKTVVPKLVHAPTMPSSADITAVVDIRPFKWFPLASRRYFRFIGAYVDNWQWLAQPSRPIQRDADRAVEEYVRRMRKLREPSGAH
jgi:hypothetical protein